MVPEKASLASSLLDLVAASDPVVSQILIQRLVNPEVCEVQTFEEKMYFRANFGAAREWTEEATM